MLKKLITSCLPFHHQLTSPSSALIARSAYAFAFFRASQRAQQMVITQNIKGCETSEAMRGIIERYDSLLNIVHLTAILDRIEEQDMLNRQSIVEYVIGKLEKNHSSDLQTITPQNVRTICNIICYLGNLKNTSLNHILIHTNYSYLLLHKSTLQMSMIITGLIRLRIYHDIFGANHKKYKKPLILAELVNESYTRTEILAIWFAYISDITKQNTAINTHMNRLIGKAKSTDIINLRTYTYALVCFVKCSYTFEDPFKHPLFELIANWQPQQVEVRLLTYELSLLLSNVNKLRHMLEQSGSKEHKIGHCEQFRQLVRRRFKKIYWGKNITLRNVANIFKEYDEAYGYAEVVTRTALSKSTAIILEEMKLASEGTTYQLKYKVDLLSLCSLTWKLSEYLKEEECRSILGTNYSEFVMGVIGYLKLLNNRSLLKLLSNKQILMLYRGLSTLKHHLKLEFDSQFVEITSQLICDSGRNLTLKEVTLLWTYLTSMDVSSRDICYLVKYSLNSAKNLPQFDSNPKARAILSSKCTMDRDSDCLKCFSSFRSG